jgi:hypothetical protein
VNIDHIFVIFISILLQLQLRQLANMPKNDKACEKKVAAAVSALMWFTGMKVHEAMDYARFSKKEINDVNVRRVVSRRLFRAMEAATPPPKERYC